MKRIIIAFTAIFTMLLYIASPLFIKPLKAYADYNFANLTNPLEDILEEYESANTKPNNFYTKEFLSNNLHNPITADTYVLYFKTRNDHAAGHDIATYNHSVLVKFDSGNITFEDGILYGENLVNGEWQYSEHYGNYYSDSFVTSYNINKIEIDFENKTFHAYDAQTSQEVPHIDSHMNGNPCTDIWDIQSNIPDMLSSDSLNIEVNFYPPLAGSVDRKINGNVSETFTMEVINHGRTGIQYLMTILPHGETAQFYDSEVNGGNDVSSVLYGNQYTFVFWRDEPNYNYDSTIQTTFAHAHHPVASETFTAVKQLSPSPWHYLAPDGIDRQTFNWSQINLEKLGSYDVYVYAMRNDYGYASRQAAFSDGDYYVDYSTIETVYYSNFVLLNGYKYDDTDQSHGVYRYKNTGDALNLGLSSSGTYDNNGNFNFEMRDMEDFDNKHVEKMKDYTEAYQKTSWSNNSISSGSADIPKSLSNSFTSFMKFINWAFSKFPSDIQYIFLYGFIAIVALGIVLKVVK